MIPESYRFSKVAQYHDFAVSRAIDGFGSDWQNVCSLCTSGISKGNRKLLISVTGTRTQIFETNFAIRDGTGDCWDNPNPEVPASVDITRGGLVVKVAHYTMGTCEDTPSGMPGLLRFGLDGLKLAYSFPRNSLISKRLDRKEAEQRIAATRHASALSIAQEAPVVFGRSNVFPSTTNYNRCK